MLCFTRHIGIDEASSKINNEKILLICNDDDSGDDDDDDELVEDLCWLIVVG